MTYCIGVEATSFQEAAMSTSARDTTMQIRIASEDKEVIRRAAAQSGQDLSSFVLQHMRKVADEILAERTVFTMSDEQFDTFLSQLDSPARSLPGLKVLLDRPSPFSDR